MDGHPLDMASVTIPFKARYDNYIGGKRVAPTSGKYFENTSPVVGTVLCEAARSNAGDIELAPDAARAAKDSRDEGTEVLTGGAAAKLPGDLAREPQDDAGPLSADQEHAGQLFPEKTGFLPETATGWRSSDRRSHSVWEERMDKIPRVTATPAALDLIAEIRADHPEILFHQSGGGDVSLGSVGGVRVHTGGSRFEVWKHTQRILDVVDGRGGMFSPDNGRERRFLARSRVFTEAETAQLSELIAPD